MGLKNIREKTRFKLSGSASSQTSSFIDAYNSYDFAIGGVPFLSAVSKDNPAVIKSAAFRKQQVDQSQEPGEQSLTGWWVRSQLSFHGGAGLKFSDPGLDESAPFRYFDSEGVNVWTPGQVTLLPEATKVLSLVGNDPTVMVGGRVSNTDMIVWGKALTAGWVNSAGTNTNLTVTGPPTKPWQSVASDGAFFYFASADGVWRLAFDDPPSTYAFVKLWTFPGGVVNVTLGWVKGRLMAGIDAKLYELVPPAGAIPYALPTTAVYTSLVKGWQWSSITAGPEAIYAAGYSGNRGSVLRVAVDTQGALPVLSGATEVAQLPTGEYPLVIRAYLGTLLCMGTNKGVRVADIRAGGDITYGPLIETERPVLDLVGVDRFVYATVSSATPLAGLLRLDLSVKQPNGRYAYASDLKAQGPDTSQAVAMVGDTTRVAFSLNNSGIYFQSLTNLIASGWLRTAQTRYNTLWPKLFKRMSVRAEIFGSLVVETVDPKGTRATIATLDSNSDLTPDLSINAPDSPQESLGMVFTLNRANLTTGPTFRGYALKATPGGPRQFTYDIPLLCFDSEKDGDGNVTGEPGWGYQRLRRIMNIQTLGSVVLFEDLANGISALITIEEMQFLQSAPGGGTQKQWGGVLTLSMRTIE